MPVLCVLANTRSYQPFPSLAFQIISWFCLFFCIFLTTCKFEHISYAYYIFAFSPLENFLLIFFALVKIILYLLYNLLICSVNIHGADSGGLGQWAMANKIWIVPSRNLQCSRGIQVIKHSKHKMCYKHSKKCLCNRV